MVYKNTVRETVSNQAGLKGLGPNESSSSGLTSNGSSSEPSLQSGQITRVIKDLGSNSIYEFYIAGVPYRLKTHHQAQMVEQLVRLVHQKMEAALKATRSGSYQNAAVLTALQLAEEMMNLKQNARDQISEIETQLSDLKSKIELLEHREEFQTAHEISEQDVDVIAEPPTKTPNLHYP